MAKREKKESEELSFEEALERLETLVESLEEGELPLEEAIATFEEGTRLKKICLERLRDAERKIELLVEDSEGELSATPIEEEELASE